MYDNMTPFTQHVSFYWSKNYLCIHWKRC